MPDQPTFVVNDRRKFTADGELRHDLPTEAAPKPPASTSTENTAGPRLVPETASAANTNAELSDLPESDAIGDLQSDPELASGASSDASGSTAIAEEFGDDTDLPPGPTAEQAAEATRAYNATVDRLDTAMRASNPGGDHMPPMTFDRLVQSLYTQSLILLGGGAQPGETPRVDILGARETIDMLSVLADKSKGNLSPAEDKLLQSALFDLRMGFLEITQALARQAAQRQSGSGPLGGMPPAGAGPRIVR